MKLECYINGQHRHFEIEPGDILLDVLRREGYLEVKRGCDTGDCGACAVIINGAVMNSCLVFAASVSGKTILTCSSVGTPDDIHLLQETFIEEVIKPAVEDHLGEKVRNLRSKGYNDNQIASMLMIHKHIVENIK